MPEGYCTKCKGAEMEIEPNVFKCEDCGNIRKEGKQ